MVSRIPPPGANLASAERNAQAVLASVLGRTWFIEWSTDSARHSLEWELVTKQLDHAATRHVPWNEGKLVGQKAPLGLKDIWAIRGRLQIGQLT